LCGQHKNIRYNSNIDNNDKLKQLLEITCQMNDFGYLHPLYAHSLIEFGQPIKLPSSLGWILKRSIPQTPGFDGIGCYPIFACENWAHLGRDLDWMADQLISLSLVTDPFGAYSQKDLLKCFQDIAIPYKEHFVVDLQQSPQEFVNSHHQRNAQKALKTINVEVCIEPIQFLDDWVLLYDNLIQRHDIRGIARFSRESFMQQLTVPGIVAFRAVFDNQTIGMSLWYVQGEVAYYHLGAYSDMGYDRKVSFAIFWVLLEYFGAKGLRWLSLGAGAGIRGDQNDGLTRFKQGWSTGTRTAYFCGRIFDREKYQEIISMRKIGNTHYFPAYRADEFA
jgi:hypothetical protein